MDEEGKERVIIKFFFLGASRSGKSCTMTRLVENTFSENYIVTIGIDFRIKYFPGLHPTKKLCLQIWDNRSDERFRCFPVNYHKNSDAIFVFFDITNRESFEQLGYQLEKIKHTQEHYQEIYIIGNKIDLESRREIGKEEANQFAKENGCVKYIELSARDGTNINETFDEIAKSFFLRKSIGEIPLLAPPQPPPPVYNEPPKYTCIIQ